MQAGFRAGLLLRLLRHFGAKAMVTQGSVLAIDLAGFSAQLLETREVFPRARIIAQTITELFPAAAANIYLLSTLDGDQVWVPQATVGEVAVHDTSVPAEQGPLGLIASKGRSFALSGMVPREEYAHLNVRRTLNSLGYLPLTHHGQLLGAIEILSFETELTIGTIQSLQPLAEVSASALANAVNYEEERHSTLSSISRLTQLYDLEKVFSSTLELDQLLPIIGSKFREVLECQAVNVWLLQGDESLLLMNQAGTDPTTREGATQKPGEGIAGDVSDNGEPALIESADDERLVQRNAGTQEGRVFSLMVAPLFDRGALVGVVEAVNRLDGTAFDEDELFALSSLNETAAGALHNASLLMAERKVEILEALVKTSAEITSTLDLDRVLQAIVNGPSAVVAYERAAIALDQRGGIQLKAVSGTTQLNVDDPQYRGLREMLQWGAILSEPLLITQRGDEIDSDREETRAKFREYFAQTGMRGLPSDSARGRRRPPRHPPIRKQRSRFSVRSAFRNAQGAGQSGHSRVAQCFAL